MNPARARSRMPVVTWLIIGLALVAFAAFRRGAFDRGVMAVREHEVVLSGVPRFVSGVSGCPEAWVDTDTQKRLFTWPQKALPAGEVVADARYTFTFLVPAFYSHDPMSVEKIALDGHTLFDASMCQVHHEAMHRTVVKALSGPSTVPDTLFPNWGQATGCQGTETSTWVCDSCRRERDRWLDKCRQSGSAAR